MTDLPYVMHPRYNDFLEFMEQCPHRKTAECLQTAFWVWLSLNGQQLTALKAELNRMHRERDSFQQQARVLSEEVERLNGLVC